MSSLTESPDDVASWRQHFPYLESGRTYMNHAAVSPFPTPVHQAVTGQLDQRLTGKADAMDRDLTLVNALRTRLAELINASSADRIALTTNTTHGLNVIASGLQLEQDDEVLLNSIEFPANVLPYRVLHDQGVVLRYIGAEDGTVPVERIKQALTPRTKVLSLSAVQFLSGYRADLAAVGQLCRDRGIVFVVDAIQALGAIELDVERMNIDALSSGGHKWLMAPQGVGFLYVSEELQQKLQPSWIGWLSVADPWQLLNYHQPLHTSARRFENGMLNFPGLHGLDAAVSFLMQIGTGRIEQRIARLIDKLAGELTGRGFSLYGPQESGYRAGILTVNLPASCDQQRLLEWFNEYNIGISLREKRLRFSPHFYNTESEIEAVVDATGRYFNS